MSYRTDKELRESYTQEKLSEFKLGDADSARIPIPSKPLFKKDKHFDKYQKISVHKDAHGNALYPAVKQIKKNKDIEGFVWYPTTRDKHYEARNWGVGKPPESVTGRAIWELGKYISEAHSRLLDGKINFSFQTKVKLIQLYQARFQLLEPLECFVNYPASILKKDKLKELKDHLLAKMDAYVAELEKYEQDPNKLKAEFIKTDINVLCPQALPNIQGDIHDDLERAKEFRALVQNASESSMRGIFRAKGNGTIMQFVRRQMLANMDRGEKINQDISFSTTRRFALTRGYQKSCWVEAKDVVRNYNPDLRNSTTNPHHGLYGKPDDLIAVDSTELQLSPEEERRTLGCIGFIEGYVKVDWTDPASPKLVSKGSEDQPLQLEKIYSPNWQVFLSWRSFGEAVWTGIKNFFVSAVWWTRLAKGDVTNAGKDLEELARGNDPFWYKAWKGVQAGWFNFRDVFKSFWDFFVQVLFVEMRNHIKNDFLSTRPPEDEKGKAISDLDIFKMAETQIADIQKYEKGRLKKILKIDFNIDLEKEEEVKKARYACELFVTTEALDEKSLREFKTDANAGYVLSGDSLFYFNKTSQCYQAVPCSVEAIRFLEEQHQKKDAGGEQAKKLSAADLVKISLVTGHAHTLPKERHFPHVDYHLTPGEQNDIFTAIARGGADTISYLSKNLFIKDPLAGAAYTLGDIGSFLVVMLPQLAAKLGSAGTFLQALSKSWGANNVSGGIAVGATVGPVAAASVNVMLDGNKSWVVEGLKSILADPASAGAKVGVAWLLGELLANGIHGYDFGAFSRMLREDLGENPDVGYLFITFKLYLLVKEALHRDENDPFKGLPLALDDQLLEDESLKDLKRIRRFQLIAWLSRHQADIPKLPPRTLFELERMINKLFPDHAESLCRILYPEEQRSIAYQFFAIPLAYIPALFRLLAAVLFSSPYAWYNEYENWAFPIQNAGLALLKQARRDLTRLVVFTQEIVRGVYTFAITPVELTYDIVSMVVGRVAAIFGFASGHAFGVLASHLSRAVDWLAQFFTPGRLLKSVQVAHPNHTVRFIESTYQAVIEELRAATEKSIKGQKALDRRGSKMKRISGSSDGSSGYFGKSGSDSTLLFDSAKSQSIESSVSSIPGSQTDDLTPSHSLNADSVSHSASGTPHDSDHEKSSSKESSPRVEDLTLSSISSPSRPSLGQ
jgi:hypothetical protein